MGKQSVLFVWAVAGFVVCALAFLLVLKLDLHKFLREYFASVLIGVLAINLDLLFLLNVSSLVREKLPSMVQLLESEENQQKCDQYLRKYVYGRFRQLSFCLVALLAGMGTFRFLGLRVPSKGLSIATYCALALIFVLLGLVVAVVIGLWTWMFKFGQLKPHIRVFHPDRLGGLRPLSEISDRVVSFGAILVAVYSLGAYYSPYAHLELRRYSYSWVVMATALLIAAYVIPSYLIHRSLVDSQEKLTNHIAREYQHLYSLFEQQPASASKDIEGRLATLLWFSELIDRINLWPYRRLPLKVLAVTSLQIVPIVIDRLFPK